MSFATVERLLAGAADSNVYSREPALAIVQQLTWRGTSEFTGLASQQIVSAWVRRPTTFVTPQYRPTTDAPSAISDNERAVKESSSTQPHSFLSSTGGRVTFADIESSSDDDLFEAGYPYFANAEDSELARESIRNVLDRIGIAAKQS